MKFSDWIKSEEDSKFFNVGLVGYSETKFDEEKAYEIIEQQLNDINNGLLLSPPFKKKEPVLVSGLTNLGIPKIGYEIASKLGWKTIGISAEDALNYDLFDVDEQIIVGKEFGDESEEFISMLDCLIRVGGGPQSMRETGMAKEKMIPVYEFELEKLD